MHSSILTKAAILVFFAILLAACGGQPVTPTNDSQDMVGQGEPGSQTGPEDQSSGDLHEFGDNALNDGRPEEMLIYFEFDKSEILDEYDNILTQHAMYLADNPSVRIRLEGHTDERGTREYNIGLGERRAQAVRQVLMSQGVSASQITTVSFGEERPARPGSNEAAYARNRRVEIIY